LGPEGGRPGSQVYKTTKYLHVALEIEKSSSWLGRPLPMTVFPLFTYTMMTVFVRLLVLLTLYEKKMESEVKYGNKTMTNSISHGKLKDEIKKVSKIHGCMDSIS
jgi:hypothetical protein